MTVYTIGYGGRTVDQFLSLLTEHGIRTVVDVRLRPDRAHSGEWVYAKSPDRGIVVRLNQVGIGYCSLPELGNLFFEFTDSLARYERLFEHAGDLLIKRLLDVDPPFALLCAENRAADCHRTTIAEFLRKSAGATIVHVE